MAEKVEMEMEMEEKAVLCHDVLSYMKEHGVSLEQAYEEKMVPNEMRMTITDITEFLFP